LLPNTHSRYFLFSFPLLYQESFNVKLAALRDMLATPSETAAVEEVAAAFGKRHARRPYDISGGNLGLGIDGGGGGGGGGDGGGGGGGGQDDKDKHI
jgi:hypothetical protein